MIYYSECDDILIKYRNKGVLIDSNILLLLFIGSYNEHLISTFKRISNFGIKDYYLLLRLLGFFKKHITTPHILTEVSRVPSKSSQEKDIHASALRRITTPLIPLF